MGNELLFALLISSAIFNVFLNIIKKVIVNKIGVFQASSISWWISFFLNPYIIAILATTLVLFSINMWIFSLITVNKMTAWMWALGIGAFILTLFLTKIFLGETFEMNLGFWLIIISMAVGTLGAWLF